MSSKGARDGTEVRDRLAEAEDRLFATVFLGSGLLFLVMLFIATASGPRRPPRGASGLPGLRLARAFAYTVINVYAIRMSAIFMLTTSTIALRTAFIARWLAAPGFALGLFLLLGSQWVDWSLIVFPAWVLLISAYILITTRKGPARARS